MKVQIREVVEDEAGLWVHLASGVGPFWAVWAHGRPNVGHEYHVELEIDQRLRLGQSAMPADAGVFAVRCDDRHTPVVVVACVTQVFPEQGTVLLQVGESLLQVELEGEVSPESWIQLQVQPLKVYDMNY
jgi:hypothetical protein